MAFNIECKYRCADLQRVRLRAAGLGATDAGILRQTDTFFHAGQSRLKLRDLGNEAQLISYKRPDSAQARGSDYVILETTEPVELAAVLTHALGVTGKVAKRRQLFLYRHTRIHLDEVEGLGSFVELETVVTDQSKAEATVEFHQVAEALDLKMSEAVALPYVELLTHEEDARRSSGRTVSTSR